MAPIWHKALTPGDCTKMQPFASERPQREIENNAWWDSTRSLLLCGQTNWLFLWRLTNTLSHCIFYPWVGDGRTQHVVHSVDVFFVYLWPNCDAFLYILYISLVCHLISLSRGNKVGNWDGCATLEIRSDVLFLFEILTKPTRFGSFPGERMFVGFFDWFAIVHLAVYMYNVQCKSV